MVADEADPLDQRQRVLLDVEDHVDAVVGQPDDLRLDLRREAAVGGIVFEQLLAVVLRHVGREDGARTQRELVAQLLVGQGVVALEGDAVDDRILDDVHDERVALAAERDVLEEAGGVEGLEAAVEFGLIEGLAGGDDHVGQDGLLADPVVALDLDGADRPARGGRRLLMRGVVAGPGVGRAIRHEEEARNGKTGSCEQRQALGSQRGVPPGPSPCRGRRHHSRATRRDGAAGSASRTPRPSASRATGFAPSARRTRRHRSRRSGLTRPATGPSGRGRSC